MTFAMVPSLGSYLGGVLVLFVILAAVGSGGYWLRRALAPSYGGATARLAELIVAATLLILTLEVLGSFGALRRGWMLVGCAALGLGATALGWRLAPRTPPRAAIPVPNWALGVAVAVAVVAVARWAMPSQLDLDRGIFSGDSTWYHLPFAIRFAQSHSSWGLLYTDPLALTAWFYPASAELLGAVGIVLFANDWLSPLINLGWLALGILAGYCLGRPRGVGPACAVAAAIVLDSGVMVLTQAGEARNDEMGVALLLAFAALLYTGYRDGGRGALAVAGLAGGLAVSVKLTMLAPVGVTTAVAVAAITIRRRGGGPLAAAHLLVAEVIAGGYWYLRNALHSGGNPVPQIHRLGPIALPHPHQMHLYPRPPRSVADYLGDERVIRVWFLHKLHDALGPLALVVLALALLAALWSIIASREAILVALGSAALATAVVYLYTPLTAAGSPGEPHGFLTNTRYLMPGVALGLVLLPLCGPLRSRQGTRALTLAVLVALFAAGCLASGGWQSRFLPGSLLIAATLILLPVLAGAARKRRLVGALAATLACLLGVAVALGHSVEANYARRHYSLGTLRANEPDGPVRIMAWARDLHGRRIALGGAGELFFDQAIYAGAEDTNLVQYIGEPAADGGYRVPSSCPAFRRLVEHGHYNFLVITEFGDNAPDRHRYPLHEWVAGDRALELVHREPAYPQTVYAYRIRGRISPRGCAGAEGAAAGSAT